MNEVQALVIVLSVALALCIGYTVYTLIDVERITKQLDAERKKRKP